VHLHSVSVLESGGLGEIWTNPTCLLRQPPSQRGERKEKALLGFVLVHPFSDVSVSAEVHLPRTDDRASLASRFVPPIQLVAR
jgi:hypothetical protein